MDLIQDINPASTISMNISIAGSSVWQAGTPVPPYPPREA